jgi:DNA-binding NtrC family response regulator
MYGASPKMREVYRMIEKVAPTEATVLIVGESGSGKELAAHTIHRMSARASGPFVAVNCGAIPATLIEAELFGYEKGAFTGAMRSHRGFFERAESGTLFLDEVTEMAPDMQVRLLRVLDSGRFSRVGGDCEIQSQVRVIAATNRNPVTAVEENHLREDLMYRLAVFPIHLPPLRERGDDIALLARHLLDELNEEAGTSKLLSEQTLSNITAYCWPGNVRELKNCIQRAFILAETRVEIDLPPPLLARQAIPVLSADCLQFEIGTPLSAMERKTILATLSQCSGDKRRTAEMLGVSLKTLYNRLSEYSRTSATS